MKNIYIAIAYLVLEGATMRAEEQEDMVKLTLKEAISLAQRQSVDSAVALSELKTAYWQYRTHRADQLPEINFAGTLPAYNKKYNTYQQPDGAYTYVQENFPGLSGAVSIDQNIALTGGKVSLNTSLDFTRQLGQGAYNELMSNIRELKNLVERTMLVSGKSVLEATDFQSHGQSATDTGMPTHTPRSRQRLTLDEIEKQTIQQALEMYAGNLSHVATALGISRSSLYRRLEKYGIPIDK